MASAQRIGNEWCLGVGSYKSNSNEKYRHWHPPKENQITPQPTITVTSLLRPFSSVPKAAFVERFNCICINFCFRRSSLSLATSHWLPTIGRMTVSMEHSSWMAVTLTRSSDARSCPQNSQSRRSWSATFLMRVIRWRKQYRYLLFTDCPTDWMTDARTDVWTDSMIACVPGRRRGWKGSSIPFRSLSDACYAG